MGTTETVKLQDAIPPQLRLVLLRIPGEEERTRFASFFLAAAKAISALGELDLARYEVNEYSSEGHILWEALAPALRDTVNAVNAFLETVQKQVGTGPQETSFESDLEFDAFFFDDEDTIIDDTGALESVRACHEDHKAEDSEQERLRRVHDVMRSICAGLAQEMTVFGEGLRNKRIATERWRFLDYLAMFRGKFRSGIGEMVFLAARQFAAVRKEDVVPYYRQEIEVSANLRCAITRLLAQVEILQQAILDASNEDQCDACACALYDELNGFVNSRIFTAVRAVEKKLFFDARGALARLTADAEAERKELLQTVEGLAKFIASLGIINQRESLVVHDRDAVARTERRLSCAERAILSFDEQKARKELKSAFDWAHRLFGRDAGFDDFLRLVQQPDLEVVAIDGLRSAARVLRTQLRAMPGF